MIEEDLLHGLLVRHDILVPQLHAMQGILVHLLRAMQGLGPAVMTMHPRHQNQELTQGILSIHCLLHPSSLFSLLEPQFFLYVNADPRPLLTDGIVERGLSHDSRAVVGHSPDLHDSMVREVEVRVQHVAEVEVQAH